MNIGNIKLAFEHKSIPLIYAARFLKNSPLKDIYHILKMKKRAKDISGRDEEFIRFYNDHEDEFQRVYNLLSDDFSKKTYASVIEFRKTLNTDYLKGVVVRPQYFLSNIVPPSPKECFVDGGGYIGDTALDFLRYYKVNDDYMIYTWECDNKNIAQIHKVLKGKMYEVEPYAMYSAHTQLRFSASGTMGSSIDETGNVTVEARSIDEVHKDHEVTFIKMDIEGAEMDALKGAENLIKQRKPKLAICIYHKPEHLYEIALYIKSIVPEYKIYIRQHEYIMCETVLYASL